MFESLTSKLDSILSHLRGRGKLTEATIKEAMREIRLALLEADVNFQVVKDFVQRVREQASGQEVMRSLTPGQQVVKIVRDELAALMGGEHRPLTMASKPPTTILLLSLLASRIRFPSGCHGLQQPPAHSISHPSNWTLKAFSWPAFGVPTIRNRESRGTNCPINSCG